MALEKQYRKVTPVKSQTEVEYKLANKPQTEFPFLLTQHLVSTFGLQGKVLDAMCGRGEYSSALDQLGLDVWCADMSSVAASLFAKKDERLRLCDLNLEDLPFEDESFDVVFCKSAIEHVNADHMMSEFRRILKPGGKVLILTGDWFYSYRVWYSDHTHGYGVPWMTHSLDLILDSYGFESRIVENIFYLPFTWKSGLAGKLARAFCHLVRIVVPYQHSAQSKWTGALWKLVRFSHEVQIVGYGIKH